MSTTTVSFTSTTEKAEIAALRKREAEARAAARRAAQRAEAARVRAEVEKRRIAKANQRISELDGQFQDLVARLDDAASRLPDLKLLAPALTSVGAASELNASELEQLADVIAAEVKRFSAELDVAISQAERLLTRRLACVAAWRDAQDLEQQIELHTQASVQVAAGIGASLQLPPLPTRPRSDAELETVQAYVSALQVHSDAVEKQHSSLTTRSTARDGAIALSGDSVQAQSANSALRKYDDERRQKAKGELRTHLGIELARRSLSIADLSESLRGLIEDALATAADIDHRGRLTRWIARASQQDADTRQALALLQRAPDLVHENPLLGQRWDSLAAQLQRIAIGLEAFTASVDREYRQLAADAQRVLNTAFTKADWVRAMCEQGFEVLEREDGTGMILVDLDHPDVWLEATELEADRSGYAVSLELKTDAAASDNDALVTDAVCKKLSKASASSSESVSTVAEEVERESRITKGRRPATMLKTFARTL